MSEATSVDLYASGSCDCCLDVHRDQLKVVGLLLAQVSAELAVEQAAAAAQPTDQPLAEGSTEDPAGEAPPCVPW